MLTYRGKYNTAHVMVDIIDSATAGQIISFLNHPAFRDGQVRVMPDCHFGNGACIGFTAPVGDMVIPNVVGVDIGCGMTAIPLPVKDIDFQKLDDVIRAYVPHGFRIHDDADDNLKWLSDDVAKSYTDLAHRVGQKPGRAIPSLGTLGGGNHFIEVDKAPDGTLWLVVHSGSRNLGLAVAKHHQNIAKGAMADAGVTGISKDMAYLTGDAAAAYIRDMHLAQDYAATNRLFIIRRIMAGMFDVDPLSINDDDTMSCVHNFISPRDGVIRKGAIAAHAGDKVIIPLNMRDGIIFGTGLGNPDWNNSAPHGAGRVLSRSAAKKTLSVDDFADDMDGIWTSCVGKGTLDEAPAAYKPMDIIMDVIGQTVDVDFVAKPVYNFKAN
jgi:RNA-splicing ligase RtcB